MKKFIVRFLAFVGFVSLLPVFVLLFIKVFDINIGPTIQPDTVLTLDTSDSYPEMPSNSLVKQVLGKVDFSFLQLISAIYQAKSDARIKGIVLRVDGATLGFAQMEELRAALQDFRTSGKFIVAYANSFGELSSSTKMFYIASCADKIIMQPYSHLTLTGFHVDQPFLKKFLDKVGIEPQVLTRKEYKNAFAFMTDVEFSEAHRTALNSLLQDLYGNILATIAKGRELNLENLTTIIQSEIFISDTSAIEKGLIDQLMYIDEVKQYVTELTGVKKPHFIAINTYITLKAREKLPKLKSDSKIALIYGQGTIQQESGDATDFLDDQRILSAEQLRQGFNEALDDPKVSSILLRLDTPGGSAVASETVRRCILRAQKKGVPVVVSVGNISASGGYWIMAPANQIFADNMSITGSIGVILGKLNFRKVLENVDVQVDSLSVGENGSISSPLSPFTSPQLNQLNQALDLLYLRFKTIVSEGRKLDLDHVDEVAKGRVWSGSQAKKYGLIDQIGGIRDAINYIKKPLGLAPEDMMAIQVYPAPVTTLQALKNAMKPKPALMTWVGKLSQLVKKLEALQSTQIRLETDVPTF